MANESWLPWGRGTGKTVGAGAPWILHKVQVMPGSSGGLLGQSFNDIKSKILPPVFNGFGIYGLKLDVHYTFGKVPPENWKRPYTPVLDWKHVIAFPNGTVIHLISLHQQGSANSYSLQWIYGPEAKFFKPDQLRGEVFPILRGHVDKFGDSPWYGAKLFETDKLSPNIHWLLEKKKLHDEELVAAILYYQAEVNELQQRLTEVSESHAYKIKQEISDNTAVLNALRKECVYYGEASSYDNIANLSPEYFQNMKRSLTEYEFDIAILNKDPLRVEGGFYPDRKEEHLYMSDSDEDLYAPLAVSLDYQASISPMIVAQKNDRVIPGVETLNILNSLYVKHPKGLKDVVQMFHETYKHRPCKEVLYYFDHTAVGKDSVRLSYHMEVKGFFDALGWRVTLVNIGQAPYHQTKYNSINKFLRGEGKYLVRFHMERASSVLLSMDLSKIKKGSTFEKDKSTERDDKYPQEKSTHLSDAVDMLLWGVLEKELYPAGAGAGIIGRVGAS